MIFNSIDFGIFFLVVFTLYWMLGKKDLKWQNLLLFVSSSVFYGFWDWRFVFLLLFSTFLDFYSGLKIAGSATEAGRKFWLWLSVLINVGFLGVFKYFNFFSTSFADLVSLFGMEASPLTLNVVLPVGISFYTFHGLSYVIDIYYNRIPAEKDLVSYSVFVSFFPLLVAGPIERATHLLPQVKQRRTFDPHKAVDGLRQILWGLFKKTVIADQCAPYVNDIFGHYNEHSGSTLLLGAVLFSFQIYCDFSGYSDIALGTARLFGIELLRNFAFPYFSRDIAEFWRRWHISLSSWFRDYLYIPLGGSKGGTWLKVRNTFIIFLVSGFWHGANWTFIFWGLLNALYIMPSIVFGSNRVNLEIVAKGKSLPTLKETLAIVTTFILTTLAWIFFRSESMTQAFGFIGGIFGPGLFSVPEVWPVRVLVLVLVFVWIEWIGREHPFAIKTMGLRWPAPVRYLFYYVLGLCVVLFNQGGKEFIYFQF